MEADTDREIALQRLVNAALPHVIFDGWSQAAVEAAIAESGVPPGLAHALVPRGGIDLALAYHHQGDRQMARTLAETDLSALRFREKVTHAVRLRLEGAGGDRALWGHGVKHGSGGVDLQRVFPGVVREEPERPAVQRAGHAGARPVVDVDVEVYPYVAEPGGQPERVVQRLGG